MDFADPNRPYEILDEFTGQGVTLIPHRPRYLVGVLDKLNRGTVSVAIDDVRRDTKWSPLPVPCRAGTRSVTITWGMTLITNGLKTIDVEVGRAQWVEIHARPRLLRWPRVWIERRSYE